LTFLALCPITNLRFFFINLGLGHNKGDNMNGIQALGDWVVTHRVWSGFLFLMFVIIIQMWKNHRQALMQHLAEVARALTITPTDDTYTIATVKKGGTYPITISKADGSFSVRDVYERYAVFEVVLSPNLSIDQQGRVPHGWAFEINRTGFHQPDLYPSPVAAAAAMERRFSADNKHVLA
jgi:hypothetical protein